MMKFVMIAIVVGQYIVCNYDCVVLYCNSVIRGMCAEHYPSSSYVYNHEMIPM